MCYFILIFTANIFAQTDTLRKRPNVKIKAYIVAGIGWTIPMGEYASTSSSDLQAGYAKPGVCRFIEAGVPIKNSNFGFTISISNGNNDINSEGLYNRWIYDTPGSYKITTILGGVSLAYLIEKLSIDIKLLAGLSGLYNLTIVTQSITYGVGVNSNLVNPDITTTSYPSSISYASTYGGSIALRYALRNHICLFFQYGFIHTEPQIPIISSTYSYLGSIRGTGASSGSITSEYRSVETKVNIVQPILLFNLYVGLGYQF